MNPNVEFVRAALEQLQRIDAHSPEVVVPLLARCHRDIEWDTTAAMPDGQVYRGHVGVQAFFRQWLGCWRTWGWEVERIRGAGPQVVVILREWGVSKSGLRVEQRHAQVWTVRAGQLVRWRAYMPSRSAVVV